MVEFTLVLPLLVLLFLGVIGFGYSFHMYNRLEEAVRAGARHASMCTYDAYNGIDPAIPPCALWSRTSFTLTGSSEFLTAVRNVVVYGTPVIDATSPPQPIVEGVMAANVGVTLGVVGAGVDKPANITTVTVAIQGLPLRLLGGTITLNKPVTTFEYVGQYSPANIEKP